MTHQRRDLTEGQIEGDILGKCPNNAPPESLPTYTVIAQALF
jgi:hypothetical protein